jgi:hypothetical protein
MFIGMVQCYIGVYCNDAMFYEVSLLISISIIFGIWKLSRYAVFRYVFRSAICLVYGVIQARIKITCILRCFMNSTSALQCQCSPFSRTLITRYTRVTPMQDIRSHTRGPEMSFQAHTPSLVFHLQEVTRFLSSFGLAIRFSHQCLR